MGNPIGTGRTDFSMLDTYADLAFVIPFWIDAIHMPVDRNTREDFIQRLATLMNQTPLVSLRNWGPDHEFRVTDPWHSNGWLAPACMHHATFQTC